MQKETLVQDVPGRVVASSGEGFGVFGSGGGAVPWSDRFLCEEDFVKAAVVGRG